jgi:putative sigma-54 modulation protein
VNIVITGRKVDVTSALRKYAEEKIGKFDRYLANISEAVVTLSIQKHLHKTEVLLKVNGTMIQAEGVTEELYSSIDEVVDKLDKQVKKLKGKQSARRKSSAGGKEPMAAPEAPVEEAPAEGTRAIVRKSIDVKPMTPEEASLQLEMGTMDFLVFTNPATGETNVIYRMANGNFGLIEPAR